MVDRRHFGSCSHLEEFGDLKKPISRLKKCNLREWNPLDIILMIMRFTAFSQKIA
jgi:hypothetical protein